MAHINDPNKQAMISAQVPAMLKEKSIKAAAACGISFSPFVRRSLHLAAHFTPEFWQRIDALAEVYGIGCSRLIEDIVDQHIARSKSDAGCEAPVDRKPRPRRKLAARA